LIFLQGIHSQREEAVSDGVPPLYRFLALFEESNYHVRVRQDDSRANPANKYGSYSLAQANIIDFRDRKPKVAQSAFVDPTARVIGEVRLDAESSVWAGAVVRGDDAPVQVGKGTAILENCVVEAPEDNPVVLGDDAIVSHGAIVHGAHIGSGCLVGIGAIVLDGAVVGEHSVIGAGAVVSPGTEVPPKSLVLGIPGRVVRSASEDELANVAAEAARIRTKARMYKEVYANQTGFS
jgi:carbonic anhydrase/acetyltransferase-like protein (isoleucine patch superfamily)